MPGETGNLSDPEQQKRLEGLMVLTSPCATLIVGTGQDGHAKNTPRGNITNDLDDAKYLSLPLSLVSPFVGDQEVLDAHISNPVLHKPTNCSGQAPLSTAALPTSTSNSLVLTPLGGTHIVGAGQDGHAKITPQGGITNDLNFAQFPSLLLPLIPHVIGDQGDLCAHISNPALHHPTKKAFHGDQALLDTAALLGPTFASLASAPLGKLFFVGAGQDGNTKNTPQGDTTNNPNNDKYSSLLSSQVPPFIGDLLYAYISNQAMRQPKKKVFCGSQALCVTAALLTSTAASPARIIIYTNKIFPRIPGKRRGFYLQECRECTSKFPGSSLGASDKGCKSTYCAKKMVFDPSLDEQELLQTKEESCWLFMAPLDRFIDKETQADTAQENACASCVKIQREQFKHTARQNCDLPGVNNTDGGPETTPSHKEDSTKDNRMDNNGI